MTTTSDALRVVLTRDVEESHHLVDAVVADANGVVDAWGDPNRSVVPRSAIKFIQAIPLVRTGAAAAFDLTPVEYALAAASHSGEPDHIATIESWLSRIGLSPDALECGVDRPLGRQASDNLFAAGGSPMPIHNCCSGKHAGFLTTALHLGVDPAGYIERDHPIQQLVTEAIEQFVGMSLADRSNGLDGCGIPTFDFSLESLAVSMARFADPSKLGPGIEQQQDTPGRLSTANAVSELHRHLKANPWWIAGTGRPEVALASIANEQIILKTGAEGVFMGLLPERGLGLALKTRDGAVRGGNAGVAALLEHMGIVPTGTSRSVLTNRAGDQVGEMFVKLS